ncbi:MAG: quinoprotein dehydrogenase-associated SoxYZ-like carrier [Marinobacter sp.]|nr:quinoprotein dehydrogenase-associated SoxYZ-like carrier [Marinobacter sp.]
MTKYGLCALLLIAEAAWAGLPVDPLGSPLWEYNIERYLGEGVEVVVDNRVGLSVPGFAEDSTQVPLAVNLSEFPHEVAKVVTWVDMNPVPLLFNADSSDGGLSLISLNFRVQQASSVRAAVLDEQGVWHIDSGFVEAAGGGCTAPREVISSSDWENEFGTLKTGLYSSDGNTRIKASLLHPMDSGMVGNVPAFYVGKVEVRQKGSKALLLSMTLAESAAENPMFVFEFEGEKGGASEDLSIWMKDNNGYRFEGAIGGTTR